VCVCVCVCVLQLKHYEEFWGETLVATLVAIVDMLHFTLTFYLDTFH